MTCFTLSFFKMQSSFSTRIFLIQIFGNRRWRSTIEPDNSTLAFAKRIQFGKLGYPVQAFWRLIFGFNEIYVILIHYELYAKLVLNLWNSKDFLQCRQRSRFMSGFKGWELRDKLEVVLWNEDFCYSTKY